MDRYLPLIAGLYFFVVGLFARVVVHRVRHGSPGIRIFGSLDPMQVLRDSMHGVVHLTITAQVFLAAIAPDLHAQVGRLAPGGWGWLRPAGAAVVFVAGLLLARCQAALGASWTMGIDENTKPGLVTGGPYSLCRNPIFVCLLAATFGFLMLMPNWVSLACLLVSAGAVRWQAAAEEARLTIAYGEEYLWYASRVGRFTPWTGRLPRPPAARP